MKRILGIFLLLCCICVLKGQTYSLIWESDQDSVLLGTPLHVTIEAVIPDTFPPNWKNITDSIRPWEILGVDSTYYVPKAGGLYRHIMKLRLISFEAGDHRTGPLVMSRGNDTIYSNILNLRVVDVAVDTTKDIRPIVPPMKVPLTWKEWILRIVAVWLLVAVLIAMWLFWRGRKKRKKIPVPVIDKPAKDWALDELRKLEKMLPAVDASAIKQYYDRLSYIIRVFMHYQYGIPALELTSREIAKWSKDIAGYEKWSPSIMPVIHDADLAKFAKATYGEDHQRQVLGIVRNWIEGTASIPKELQG